MDNKLTKKWEHLIHDYCKKLRALDDPNLTETELEAAKNEAGEAAKIMSEFGYEMANDLDNIRNDLFPKWWFKLFTKLKL